jgi:phosphatidylserine/phosphatidylglycerophosphate/cardiolipin synthase-like enzyme
VKKKGDDQNDAARDRLRPRVDLHDRMTSPRALAHNKLLVICDEDGKPRWVWTGSQNWTKTGLCTQANNSILIDNQTLAREYKKQWESLRDVGDETPRALKESNSELREFAARLHLWFTPTIGEVDLEEARRVLRRSPKPRAVLFLMFNPGPKDTLLNEILALAGGTAGGNLYIRGVLNQDPSTVANPVDLFDSDKSRQSGTRILLPAAIDEPTAWFVNEIKKKPGTFAMVHSKVIVVDPFGEDPVVMTGSHNLGPKASKTNDENLLIIRGLPGVAAAYATNIMSIYNQYRWRYQRGAPLPLDGGDPRRAQARGLLSLEEPRGRDLRDLPLSGLRSRPRAAVLRLPASCRRWSRRHEGAQGSSGGRVQGAGRLERADGVAGSGGPGPSGPGPPCLLQGLEWRAAHYTRYRGKRHSYPLSAPS